ncbi:MAG: NADH-quinone oxidoreductase subunit NuoN [Alphaproteobacteria bacterium]|nr:NADH-quinone oxidoreductase subunit NuoN [Alphaproteobacteria bacterium]MDE2336463.1 NADH-quinone oxidoreductase subunit NuoN [Alphaproteobacteria bacterium]
MTAFQFNDLLAALPEVKLAALALLLLLLAVLPKKQNYRLVSWLAVATLAFTGVLVACSHEGTAFGGMFVSDKFSIYMKLLALGGSAVSLVMATAYLERENVNRIEYPVLVLFATLGMMLMISANSLIALYMGLELQSLPLYVLAAIRRDSVRSTEAGLKYFVLGALSSGLFLYGASLVYGYSGSVDFPQIAGVLQGGSALLPGVVTGMVLVLAALAFKISAVPFHMWAPDVYEGAPTPVTAFFAIAPKVAAIALLTRVLTVPFGGMAAEWQQVIVAISVLSMLLGAVAAVVQTNIKRLLAYSSIGHMGYALVGLAAASAAGVQAVVIYMTIYAVMGAGAFSVVLMMKKDGKMVEEIGDLAGLGKSQPLLAFAMAVLMFSMAGIPPLAGFFGKLFVFQAAVAAGLYTLAVVGVLTSVVAAYYYIRIVKVMYFEEPRTAGFDAARDRGLNFVLAAATLAVLVFIVVPAPVLTSAHAAALALLP